MCPHSHGSLQGFRNTFYWDILLMLLWRHLHRGGEYRFLCFSKLFFQQNAAFRFLKTVLVHSINTTHDISRYVEKFRPKTFRVLRRWYHPTQMKHFQILNQTKCRILQIFQIFQIFRWLSNGSEQWSFRTLPGNMFHSLHTESPYGWVLNT